MIRITLFVALMGTLSLTSGCKQTGKSGVLPSLDETFNNAYARVDGDLLIIGTGAVERRWRWTDQGFATSALINSRSGKDFVENGEPRESADWQLPGISGNAKLSKIESRKASDRGFSSEHLETVATINYPENNLSIQYVIWAYPDAPGLRTQIRMKTLFKNSELEDQSADSETAGIAETLPVNTWNGNLHLIGYYSDTQNRNEHDTEILKEETFETSGNSGENHWASIAALEQTDRGVILVKESHKCVNTPDGGANTGSFIWNSSSLSSSGLGYKLEDVGNQSYLECWAHWTILYSGGRDEMELALKQFDRQRYPIDPERDLYIMANTWGSTTYKRDAQVQAREENVLLEIASQAGLGIDVQQIDDGWQGYAYESWRPVTRNEVHKDGVESKKLFPDGSYSVYPEGWKNVQAFARDKGVKLGLWSAYTISAEDLIWNQEQGDFRYFKIDFAQLTTKALVDELMGKARALILHSGHKVRINWDVTEKQARVGYFFGREYGNIYLANRKPIQPATVVYKPYTVLRDAWQISKYINLNKFQVSVQNIDRVNREVSDAWKHRHDYCVAQTLMASPIFFQETQYYSQAARDEIRPLIQLYKEHREAMFKGYVFPVGNKPDNRSWSGFQNHDPQTGNGFLMLFRQIGNQDAKKSIPLRFLTGKHITLTDLRNGQSTALTIGNNGSVDFEMGKAGDFLFFRYETHPDG